MEAPSVEEIKRDRYFTSYVATQKRIFAEFLGWSEAETMALIEQQLQSGAFRIWFGHDTPCDNAVWLLIPDSIRRNVQGSDLVKLSNRICGAIEGRGRPETYNIHPDTDPKFDWQSTKQRVAQILREQVESSGLPD